MCFLHHFSAPLSNALNACISAAFCRIRFRTACVYADVFVIKIPFLVFDGSDHWSIVQSVSRNPAELLTKAQLGLTQLGSSEWKLSRLQVADTDAMEELEYHSDP